MINKELVKLLQDKILKNVEGSRNKDVRSINAMFRIGATATPVPNRLEDLEGLLAVLGTDFLWKDFKDLEPDFDAFEEKWDDKRERYLRLSQKSFQRVKTEVNPIRQGDYLRKIYSLIAFGRIYASNCNGKPICFDIPPIKSKILELRSKPKVLNEGLKDTIAEHKKKLMIHNPEKDEPDIHK